MSHVFQRNLLDGVAQALHAPIVRHNIAMHDTQIVYGEQRSESQTSVRIPSVREANGRVRVIHDVHVSPLRRRLTECFQQGV